MTEAGPFQSVCQGFSMTGLHIFLCRRPNSIPIEPFRSERPGNAAITFTHGDLIILSESEPRRIVAIVELGTIRLDARILGGSKGALHVSMEE